MHMHCAAIVDYFKFGLIMRAGFCYAVKLIAAMQHELLSLSLYAMLLS